MNKVNKTLFSFEDSDFRPFNELELSIVLGGGGDEQILSFPIIPHYEEEQEDLGAEFSSFD